MENMFSAGELAKYQGISKQTLLFYDKIGLFKPSYTDPENGYRYYSAEQLDYLDTIIIMKKIGFSLKEIKQNMEHFTMETSLQSFRNQLTVIDRKIKELSLIHNRLEHRCTQLEQAILEPSNHPTISMTDELYLLCHDVEAPFSAKEISLATKQCYAQAMTEDIPVFFQSGVSVPMERIRSGRCIEASTAYLTTEPVATISNILRLPKGLTASIYHIGNYYEISNSYAALIQFCKDNRWKIISDSYEFCINDYITSRIEDEFITKIMFYVEEEPAAQTLD